VTERLYYTDSYLCDFDARVVDRRESGRRVYLDRTAFYPTSGGQPHDIGHLAGITVIDVVDEETRIAHVLESPLLEDRVAGQVDWTRRFDHMQQHTGQHLLSAVALESLGLETVAVHFGREVSTVDLAGAQLTGEQAARLERQANEIIVENRPVHVSFEDASEAIGLRKRPTRNGTIRIVTIQQLDRSACGGTHVRATGEIGSLLVRRIERVRKATRAEFVCGARAVTQARSDYLLLTALASEFSAAPAELPHLLAAQRVELKEAESSRREMESRLDRLRARELYQTASPDAAGIRRVILQDEGSSLEELRRIARAFTTFPMAMFIGVATEPPTVVLSASPDSGIDAAGVLKGLLASVHGRGGGSAVLAQGMVPGASEMQQVLASLTAPALR
jgi:alanyl-tRNA synthetase